MKNATPERLLRSLPSTSKRAPRAPGVVALALVAATACADPAVELEVTVTDLFGGQPVEGVRACVTRPEGECAITDANGVAALAVPADAEVSLTFTGEDYYPFVSAVSVGALDASMRVDLVPGGLTRAVIEAVGGSPDSPDHGHLVIFPGRPAPGARPDFPGFTYALEPASADVVYLNDSLSPDFRLTESSVAGIGVAADLPVGDYTLVVGHPEWTCARAESGWATDTPMTYGFEVRAGATTAIQLLGCE